MLLSIYYVGVPGFDDERDSDDEAVALVSAMQWDDWRDLRLEAEDSAAYRKRVNQLATRLASISESLAARDEEVATASSPGRAMELDEPGLLDHIAEGEDAFPRLNAVIVDIGRVLRQVSEIAKRWNPTIERASEQSAAATLFAVREFSRQLDGPAFRMEELGKGYAVELVRVDPAVLALIRVAEDRGEPTPDALGLFEGIRTLNEAAEESVTMFQDLTATMEEVSGLSRDLRRPLRKIKNGLKNVLDGQVVLDEWGRRMAQVEAQWAGDDEAFPTPLPERA